MKYILFILIFCSIFMEAKSQGQPYPQSNGLGAGSATTLYKQLGAIIGEKGIITAVYPDTTTANAGYIDFYPGAIIGTQANPTDSLFVWMRNLNATRWVKINVSGGGGGSGVCEDYMTDVFIKVPTDSVFIVRCETDTVFAYKIGLPVKYIVDVVVDSALNAEVYTYNDGSTHTTYFEPIPTSVPADTNFVRDLYERSDSLFKHLNGVEVFVGMLNGASGSGAVESVTGTMVDNTDPANPVVGIQVADGITITGTGEIGNPFVAVQLDTLNKWPKNVFKRGNDLIVEKNGVETVIHTFVKDTFRVVAPLYLDTIAGLVYLKIDESNLVHRTGAESIGGEKTLLDSLFINKPIVQRTGIATSARTLLKAGATDYTHDWFRVEADGSGASRIVMRNNVVGNVTDVLTLEAGLGLATIQSGTFRSLLLSTTGSTSSILSKGRNFYWISTAVSDTIMKTDSSGRLFLKKLPEAEGNYGANITTNRFVTKGIGDSLWKPTIYPEQAYSQSVTFGGTAPTGTPTNRWWGQRVGNEMTIYFRFEWPNEGTGITSFSFPLPTGAPLPLIMTGTQVSAGVGLYTGLATVSRANGSTQKKTALSEMQYDSAATGFEFNHTLSSSAVKVIFGKYTYPVSP